MSEHENLLYQRFVSHFLRMVGHQRSKMLEKHSKSVLPYYADTHLMIFALGGCFLRFFFQFKLQFSLLFGNKHKEEQNETRWKYDS